MYNTKSLTFTFHYYWRAFCPVPCIHVLIVSNVINKIINFRYIEFILKKKKLVLMHVN